MNVEIIEGQIIVDGNPVVKLTDVLRCLKLLNGCRPKIREILNARDEIIDAAGLNPWCVAEGLADGDDTYVPYCLHDCIEGISQLIS